MLAKVVVMGSLTEAHPLDVRVPWGTRLSDVKRDEIGLIARIWVIHMGYALRATSGLVAADVSPLKVPAVERSSIRALNERSEDDGLVVDDDDPHRMTFERLEEAVRSYAGPAFDEICPVTPFQWRQVEEQAVNQARGSLPHLPTFNFIEISALLRAGFALRALDEALGLRAQE